MTPGTVRTISGRPFNVLAPDPAEVRIEDIARGLAHACRFNGQTVTGYTVAQHARHVAEVVRVGSPAFALEALLHDAAEAYLGDLARPLKVLPELAFFREIEGRVLLAVAGRFRLRAMDPLPKIVKWADDVLLEFEGAALVPGWSGFGRVRRILAPGLPERLVPEPAEVAEVRFMGLFEELERERRWRSW